MILVDPKRDLNSLPFPTLACKFYEAKYPQKLGNEGASLIAMGS